MPRRPRVKPLNSNGQNVPCHWCKIQCTNTSDLGPRGATRDHVIPKSIGASDAPRVWSCRACNEVKADFTPNEWRVFRKEFPDYRSFHGKPDLAEFRAEFRKIYASLQRAHWEGLRVRHETL
jgi:hypothetical protein